MLRLVQALGLIAAVAFFGMRSQACMKLFMQGTGEHGGDLYLMARVRDFREVMPPETENAVVHGVAAESAQVVLIGDSYTHFGRDGGSLAVRLQDRLPGLLSCTVTMIHPRFYDPSDLLRLQRIRPGAVKVVVWEIVERNLGDVALKKIPLPFHAWDTTWKFDLFQDTRAIKKKWFTESEYGYQYLLLNSIPTRDAIEAWNTTRFRISGTLPGSIGAWLPNPPHLFLAEELASTSPRPGEMPTSYLQKRDSALVEAIATSLAEVRDRLHRDFGAEFVALVIPAKSSLLHGELGHGYDAFVPRVNQALERRGIRAIDVWDPLSQLGEDATLRTDTHLSPAAYAIMTDSVASAARALLEEIHHRSKSHAEY